MSVQVAGSIHVWTYRKKVVTAFALASPAEFAIGTIPESWDGRGISLSTRQQDEMEKYKFLKYTSKLDD